jgi:hypothetical protein
MIWYWVISCDNANEDPLVADRGDLGQFEEWSFRCQGKIEHWPGTAIIQSSSAANDGDPDDALQTYLGLPVFSARLRRKLELAGINTIQYLPIRVLDSRHQQILGYSIANILSCCDALNQEESKISRYRDDWIVPERRGEISGIMKAVLHSEALEGLDIIRLQNFDPSIYVSGHFKKVFEENGFTGYSFVEVKVR